MASPEQHSSSHGIENNWIIAPFQTSGESPTSGRIITKIVDNRVALHRLNILVNQHHHFDHFNAEEAFLIDFKNIANPKNSEERNNFQIFYVAGKKGESAIIYNYWNISWYPEEAEAGVFAGRKESEQCHFGFKYHNGLDLLLFLLSVFEIAGTQPTH